MLSSPAAGSFCLKVEPQDPVLENRSSLRGEGVILHWFVPYTSGHTKVTFLITTDTSACFVALDINKPKLEYAVTCLLGADLHGRLQGYSLHFHSCGLFIWLLLKWDTTKYVRKNLKHELADLRQLMCFWLSDSYFLSVPRRGIQHLKYLRTVKHCHVHHRCSWLTK